MKKIIKKYLDKIRGRRKKTIRLGESKDSKGNKSKIKTATIIARIVMIVVVLFFV